MLPCKSLGEQWKHVSLLLLGKMVLEWLLYAASQVALCKECVTSGTNTELLPCSWLVRKSLAAGAFASTITICCRLCEMRLIMMNQYCRSAGVPTFASCSH